MTSPSGHIPPQNPELNRIQRLGVTKKDTVQSKFNEMTSQANTLLNRVDDAQNFIGRSFAPGSREYIALSQIDTHVAGVRAVLDPFRTTTPAETSSGSFTNRGYAEAALTTTSQDLRGLSSRLIAFGSDASAGQLSSVARDAGDACAKVADSIDLYTNGVLTTAQRRAGVANDATALFKDASGLIMSQADLQSPEAAAQFRQAAWSYNRARDSFAGLSKYLPETETTAPGALIDWSYNSNYVPQEPAEAIGYYYRRTLELGVNLRTSITALPPGAARDALVAGKRSVDAAAASIGRLTIGATPLATYALATTGATYFDGTSVAIADTTKYLPTKLSEPLLQLATACDTAKAALVAFSRTNLRRMETGAAPGLDVDNSLSRLKQMANNLIGYLTPHKIEWTTRDAATAALGALQAVSANVDRIQGQLSPAFVLLMSQAAAVLDDAKPILAYTQAQPGGHAIINRWAGLNAVKALTDLFAPPEATAEGSAGPETVAIGTSDELRMQVELFRERSYALSKQFSDAGQAMPAGLSRDSSLYVADQLQRAGDGASNMIKFFPQWKL